MHVALASKGFPRARAQKMKMKRWRSPGRIGKQLTKHTHHDLRQEETPTHQNVVPEDENSGCTGIYRLSTRQGAHDENEVIALIKRRVCIKP